MIKITTVYDNIDGDSRFKADWGFGCIIDHPKAKILFDTGAKAEILEANLNAASIKPESIDIVILSHKHWDHQGGVLWLAQKNNKAKIYIPKTWDKKLEKELSHWPERIHPIKNNRAIDEEFYLIVSSKLFIRELVLAIKTSQGSIILTGCSHTGIDRITHRVRKATNSNILAIFGGFHLLRSSAQAVYKIANKLKQMDVKTVSPCHCTGKEAMAIFQKEFAENYIPNGIGCQFTYNA